MKNNEKVFYRVTNRDIFDKIESLEKALRAHMEESGLERSRERLHIKYLWASISGLGTIVGLAFWFLLNRIAK